MPSNRLAPGFVARHSVMTLWWVTSAGVKPGGMKSGMAGLPAAYSPWTV